MVQFFEACTVIKLSHSEIASNGGGGDDDGDICNLLKKIYDQLQGKYKIDKKHFVFDPFFN